MAKYATIKRGKVKVKIKSKQFRFLMANHMPLSIVKKTKKGKSIKRLNTRRKR